MTLVKVNDGDGHWVDEEGKLMTTVWTSEGWLDLPGTYVVEGHVPEEECERRMAEGDDDANLDIKIRYPFEGRFIVVSHIDFEEVEERAND